MAAAWEPTGPPVEPEPAVESPASKRRLASLIEVSGLGGQVHRIDPRAATREELLRLHTPGYIDRIEKMSAGTGGDAGEVAVFGHGGFEIASLAAGGCLAAVETVMAGTVENAYALVRPPGHHAEADRGRGFCVFGNTALAALHAQRVTGVERVAIIDWDVHHGNGSEDAFFTDSSVLTVSFHQDNLYPLGSGAVDDIGDGDGRGFNINIPLPPGSGTGAYLGGIDRVVAPALRSFRPDLILIASGLDAGAMDPLGRMILTSDDFRQMTRRMVDLAGELCSGRLVFCHEGGYSTTYVPFCGLAVMQELCGFETGVTDPFVAELNAVGYRGLQPRQEEVIERLAAMLESGELAPTG